MKETKYLIEGFEWFDKANGNSYHSVDITDLDTNKLVFSSGLTYGYDDSYKSTAYAGLVKLDLVNYTDRHNHDLNNKRFIYRKVENCLKRDLEAKEVC